MKAGVFISLAFILLIGCTSSQDNGSTVNVTAVADTGNSSTLQDETDELEAEEIELPQEDIHPIPETDYPEVQEQSDVNSVCYIDYSIDEWLADFEGILKKRGIDISEEGYVVETPVMNRWSGHTYYGEGPTGKKERTDYVQGFEGFYHVKQQSGKYIESVIYSQIEIYNLTEGSNYGYPYKLAEETYESNIQSELRTFELNDVVIGEDEIKDEWKFGDESTVYDFVLHGDARGTIIFRRCNVFFAVVAEDIDTIIPIAQDTDEQLKEMSVASVQ